jgi:hypothetical protein
MKLINELFEELRLVLGGKNSIMDSIIPPLLFAITNAISDFKNAFWISIGGSLAILLFRFVQRHNLRYALGGLAATFLAGGLARLLDYAGAYYLPELVNGAATVVILLLSILLKRPAVAFTSYLTRRWPLDWYWHPQVRPAYSEVTDIWIVFFVIKLAVQYYLFKYNKLTALSVFNLVSGWPAMIVLLVISYLYGLKRLASLHGPSVEEFKSKIPPPWQGQRRGF